MNQIGFTKNVFATGANGGLGRETIRQLARNKDWRILLACRTQEKADSVKRSTRESSHVASGTELIPAFGYDMNNPTAIRAAVARLSKEHPFDVVFLGAGGVIFGDSVQTVEYNGLTIERTVFQNVIGGHVTLSELKKQNLLAPWTRVVIAGGEGARGLKGMIAKPEFASPVELRKYVMAKGDSRPYNPMNAIGVSKLLSALWCKKIVRLFGDEFNITWFSPGLTYGTGGLEGLPPAKRWFMKNIGMNAMRLAGIARSPESGGRKFADCIEGKIGGNGELIGAPAGKSTGELVSQEGMNSAFTDTSLQDELWEILTEVVGPFGG